MWNEDEFFKDYAKSVDDMKPDADFVATLKKNTNSQNLKKVEQKHRKRLLSGLAVAASLVLCVTAGGYGLGLFGNKEQPIPENPGSLSADKEEEPDIQGNISSDSPLADLASQVTDPQFMVDRQTGESLSMEEREHLASLLLQCEKTEEPADTSLEEEVYYCVGDSTLKISVYGERYVVIEEETYKVE